MAAHAKPNHDYHLVNPSPWPLVASVSAFVMAVGAILWFHEMAPVWPMLIGLVGVLYTMFAWWSDVIKEGQEGYHTPVVMMHHRYGMILFIASEVMFFVAWFWAYFNTAIFHADVSVASWPPAGIVTLDPWHLPLLNTLILLTSGTTVTWAHHAIQTGDKKGAVQGLALTVILGLCFTAVQAYEYIHAPFTFGFNGGLALEPFTQASHAALTSGVGNMGAIYGSNFFMATGFHGFHVIVGTIFLIVCLFRAMAGHFTPARHFGFEAAAWYWHFVDVVWLFLFAAIYVWGAGTVTH